MPPSCSTLTRAELTQAKKKKKKVLHLHMQSLQLCPTLCKPVDCELPGFSVKRVLQARILECIGRHWLPYPSRALYILLPRPPTPLRTWCCQNPCDPSSFTTSTPGPHWGRPKSSKEASGANLSGRPTCRGGDKTTTETQGQ